MDGNDENCRTHYRDYYEPEKIHECECECHEGQEKPELPAPHEAPRDPKAPRKKAVKK
jgi:hypothetical protein